MRNTQKRISTLLKAADNWLSSDNDYLMNAIDRTVQEGYFSFPDVKYALDAIRNSLNQTALEEWVSRVQLNDEQDAQGQNVLCLHAGNLPLVGFQDAFSTLLCGARYTGKISRKDPYLLPTFLNEVKKTALWTDVNVQWSHRLDDFEDMQNDAIIFAGSESSVPDVKEAIQEYNLAKNETRYLIRTTHFSMAYCDRTDKETLQQLAEGILRYGGQGCRSVAIVVSPITLDAVKEDLADAMQSFWSDNPQHLTPAPKLKQQFAYNKAVERSQLWLNHFLIQEEGLEFDQDFICYWIQGNEETTAELARQYCNDLQSVYVQHDEVEIPGWQRPLELLASAQQPPISWKPDGMDTLAWLAGEED